jgi:hypothetical protein
MVACRISPGANFWTKCPEKAGPANALGYGQVIQAEGVTYRSPGAKGVLMSDCLHCDIHEMMESQLQSEQADLADIAAKVTEVLADLILMAPPDEQLRLLADVLANLGGMVLEKAQETDPTNPRRSRH